MKVYQRVKTGIDVCIENGFKEFRNARLGLLIHSASVASNLKTAQELFIRGCKVVALFAPEHGIYGNLQAMVPASSAKDPQTGLPVYSLYGKRLKPTRKMLQNIDIMVIDLQDIGTRYYTFIWTMALTLQSCAEYKIPVVILDRPNPINGLSLEGPILCPGFSSFVGLYPIPVRHGMTIGELAKLFNMEFEIFANLKIIKMHNWRRNMWFDDTKLPWVPPSPNMPTLGTALVYPGMCLLEGTNISEGRGTTKPFELFGAPWIDPFELSGKLNNKKLPGVIFMPVYFTPCASRFKNKTCGGAMLHITNRNKFLPFLTGVHIIRTIYNAYKEFFKWANPPYEYEYEKLPFDLLTGSSTIRLTIERNQALRKHQEQWKKGLKKFNPIRKKYLLY